MSAFIDLTETTISRKEQYSGPLFSVHTDVVRLPDGNTSGRCWRSRRGSWTPVRSLPPEPCGS